MAWSVTEREYQYLLQKYREEQIRNKEKKTQPVSEINLNKQKERDRNE